MKISKENYDIWFECVIELTFVKEQYDFLNIHSLRFEALETFEFHQSDKILLTNSYQKNIALLTSTF